MKKVFNVFSSINNPCTSTCTSIHSIIMLEEKETTGGVEVDATSDSATPRPFRFEPKRASASPKLSTSNISETTKQINVKRTLWLYTVLA